MARLLLAEVALCGAPEQAGGILALAAEPVDRGSRADRASHGRGARACGLRAAARRAAGRSRDAGTRELGVTAPERLTGVRGMTAAADSTNGRGLEYFAGATTRQDGRVDVRARQTGREPDP